MTGTTPSMKKYEYYDSKDIMFIKPSKIEVNPIDAATPLNHIGSEAFLLSLFSQTYLRQNFKEVLTDLFCVIAVGLADEPDGIRQQDVTLRFLHFVFLVCDLLYGGYLAFWSID